MVDVSPGSRDASVVEELNVGLAGKRRGKRFLAVGADLPGTRRLALRR